MRLSTSIDPGEGGAWSVEDVGDGVNEDDVGNIQLPSDLVMPSFLS